MVDEDVVAAKLADLADRISRVRKHRPGSAKTLGEDRDALDLVSFNLMLAVQTCVDVASHLIADEGWTTARDLREIFHRLHEHGVLSRETADALGRATGLRNVVAHVYAQADPELIFRGASSGLDDLERFSREIAAWIEDRH